MSRWQQVMLIVVVLVGILPPVREEPEGVASLTLDEIEVKFDIGGLVKSFERKATQASVSLYCSESSGQ